MKDLIFQILKRGEKIREAIQSQDVLADGGLRFSLTVPLTRYFSANKAQLNLPLRLCKLHQSCVLSAHNKEDIASLYNIDIIGLDTPYTEIDLIQATVSCP